MTLRGMHVFFVIVIILTTELFGAWGVWTYQSTGDILALTAGVLSFLAGFAVVVYAIWFVRKLDSANLQ